MTPPPFETFQKIHPFWRCRPSLSLVPKVLSNCIPFHVLFVCVDVRIVKKLLFGYFFNLKLTYSGEESKCAHI